VLFCEYIPHPILDWLRENPARKAATVERQFSQIVMFLRGRELLHMDGHFGNMRTDGGADLSERLRAGYIGRISTCRPPSATSPNATPLMTPATPPCDWSTGW